MKKKTEYSRCIFFLSDMVLFMKVMKKKKYDT